METMTDTLGLFSVLRREVVDGRIWVIGLTSMDHIHVATRCGCGEVMEDLVIGLGSPPDTVRCRQIGCTASDNSMFSSRIPIPINLAADAQRIVRQRNDDAWKTRAASGGPRGWIPI